LVKKVIWFGIKPDPGRQLRLLARSKQKNIEKLIKSRKPEKNN